MKAFLIGFSLFLFSSNMLLGASESHTFVLVHGAWHGNWTFYKLQYELEKAGHSVICVNLPGHGLDWEIAGSVTLADYQNAIVEVLDTLADPAVLVGHSMGGIAISMAAEARPEKIDKLVYLAAFMPQNGQTMMGLAMQDSNSMIGPSLIIDTATQTVDLIRENVDDIFYDASTAEYVLISKMLLTPNPLLPLITPLCLTDENYGSVRRFYITTNNDKAITPDFQEVMYTALPCEKVYALNTEHSPFFSATVNLKNILDKIGDDDNPLKTGSTSTNISASAERSNNDNTSIDYRNGFLNIDSHNPISNCRVTIYNLEGKILQENTQTPNSNSFNLYIGEFKRKAILLNIDLDGNILNKKLYFR